MLRRLVVDLDYTKLETCNRLIGKLQRVAIKGDATSFQDFETDLAKIKSERDSFSEEERKIISGFLGEEIPPVFSRGDYLDELEVIVYDINMYLNDKRGDMESGYDGGFNYKESDDGEGPLSEDLSLICQRGLDDVMEEIDRRLNLDEIDKSKNNDKISVR